MRTRFWLTLCLAIVILISGGCAASSGTVSSNFDDQFNTIVQPYSFNLLSWEVSTVLKNLKQRVFHPEPESTLTSQNVLDYFSYVAQANTLKSQLNMVQVQSANVDTGTYESKISQVQSQIDALKPIVEQTLALQISQILKDQGIYSPFMDWFKIPFPPVNFALEKPLNVLIVSPLDKIERIRNIVISPDITTAQKEDLESSLEKLGVSALVIQIGGLGATYPSFVIDNADLRFTINAAVEEWLHQYLAFEPLGFRYVLDLLRIHPQADIPNINETVAGIAAQELGALVYDKYYAQYNTDNTDNSSSDNTQPSSGFDFNAAMREIRINVDNYLASGQVEQAMQYMEAQRQYLVSKGYYIRKLNQAYFAFYGSYAYGGNGAAVDPTGNNLKLLRDHSLSVKDFLDRASKLSGSQSLEEIVSQYK